MVAPTGAELDAEAVDELGAADDVGANVEAEGVVDEPSDEPATVLVAIADEGTADGDGAELDRAG